MQTKQLALLGGLWAVLGSHLLAPGAFAFGEALYPPADIVEIVARINGQRLSVACRGTVAPSAAVVAVGMTAEGLKPADVQQQLDRQLAAVDELAKGHGGTVRRLERLRAVRGLEAPGQSDPKAPFVVLQRLEIELPIAAPIDEILDRLLLLGVDRFGNEMKLEDQVRGAKLVALYRFDGLGERLQGILAECRKQGYRSWCDQRSSQISSQVGAQVRESCVGILEGLDDYFRDDGLRLDGLRTIDPYGGVQVQSLVWPSPGMRVDDIRVGSSEPVELTGTLYLQLDLRPR